MQGNIGTTNVDRIVQPDKINGIPPCCTAQLTTAARSAPHRGRRKNCSNNWPGREVFSFERVQNCGLRELRDEVV